MIGAILALLLIAGGAAAFVVASSQATEVVVAEVVRGDLSVTVSASGRVSADDKIDLYPSSAGVIESIEVTDGQRVKAGQVIATLDTAPLEAQLAQAEAAYAGAVAQRDAATRAVPGEADRSAADAAVAAARSAYDAARAQYDAAVSGAGAPGAAELAQAKAALTVAEAAAASATEAYDRFYTDVYLPAPDPKDPALEAALVALELARTQAEASLADARQAVAVLESGIGSAATVAAATLARDQAYAAYLGAISQRDALAKASNIGAATNAADAAVAAADAARTLASEALDNATIVAPVDGVVIFSAVTNPLTGAAAGKPAPGSSVSPASAPFAIVGFNELTFTAQVDEADITRVAVGMKALVSLDGLPEADFETEVLAVQPQSVLTPTGGTAFPVTMRIINRDDAVLIGMNGSVEIEVEMVEDTLIIPVEALLEDREGSYVYLVRDDVLTRVGIETGRLTDTSVGVESGLSEGDQVIVSDVAELAEGDPVKVR
jgi:HlyD family secretion protein